MITNYQLDLQIKWGVNVFYNYSFNSFVRGLLFFLIQTWLLLNSIFQSLTKLPGPPEQLQHDLVDLKHVLSQSLQLLQAAFSLLLSFFAYLLGIQIIKSNFWKIVQNMNIRIKKNTLNYRHYEVLVKPSADLILLEYYLINLGKNDYFLFKSPFIFHYLF